MRNEACLLLAGRQCLDIRCSSSASVPHVRDTKPYCVIGSPPCIAFSPRQEIGRSRRDPKVMNRELEEGKAHVRFCLELWEIQLREFRHFIHEHLAGWKAWNMPEMVQFMLKPEVDAVVTHMCAYGTA